MQILVVGGSNSLLRDGYVYHFMRKMESEYGNVKITNRSAGGTTSITSLALLDKIKDRPDLILLEYSLNDTGHINHLPDAYQKKWEMLELFYGFVAERFEGVPVLPLLLASEPFYDLDVTNNVYRAEKDFYNQHGMIDHDMRQEFNEFFGGEKPSFLYSDLAHFHRGFASALIGRTLAQTAQRILSMPSDTNVYAGPSRRPLKIIQADAIAGMASLPIDRAANSHLQIDCVVISEDTPAVVDLPGWPVCLYVASDTQHTNLSLDINGEAFELATMHRDCHEGKLIFTSVPMFLNDRFMALQESGPTQIKLSLKRGADTWIFDCLEGERDISYPRRVRLAAIATV
jgi:hypothetical protein